MQDRADCCTMPFSKNLPPPPPFTQCQIRHWSSNITNIVLWSCFTSLLSSCRKYGRKFGICKLSRKMSAVVVTITCICKNWHEGILFLLLEYSLLETPFPEQMSDESCIFIVLFSWTLYPNLKRILFPPTNFVHKQCHKSVSEGFRNLPLDLIGDGRFDSEGINAKYGTYSLTNAHNNHTIKKWPTSCRLQ